MDITILDGNSELYKSLSGQLLALEFKSLDEKTKQARAGRAIGTVLQTIEGWIMALERRVDEIERLEEANAEEAVAREIMKKVDAWFDERRAQDSDLDRMRILVEDLGEAHVELRKGRTIPPRAVLRLEKTYQQWNNTIALQLTKLVTEDLKPDEDEEEENPTLVSLEDLNPANVGDRLLMMSTYLEADFKMLKENFFSGTATSWRDHF